MLDISFACYLKVSSDSHLIRHKRQKRGFLNENLEIIVKDFESCICCSRFHVLTWN